MTIFLRLSGFLHLFDKVYFLINVIFLLLEFATYSREQCKQNKLLKTDKWLHFSILSLEILEYLTLQLLNFHFRFTSHFFITFSKRCNVFFHKPSTKMGWHEVCFIVSANKYDWRIDENLFASIEIRHFSPWEISKSF